MPLAFKLASRNLFHDRLRFIATIIGIVFSIVLVTVQMGLYLGFGRMVTTMIDHASADLWIMPRGTKCFEDPSLLDERQRFRALSISGVADATPIVIGFAEWRLPKGGTTPVFIIGSDMRAGGLHPWNLVEGSIDALSIPNAVAVDQTYFERLGITGIGAAAEIREQKVQVRAVTKGIRSFTTTPYVFTPLDRARAYTGVSTSKATYFLVRLASKADVESVRSRLQANLSDVEVLTPAEFRDRSRDFLAVRHRRRRRAVRRRIARRDRRHRHRGTDAVFQHQGSSQRVRHAARHRVVRHVHPQGDHLAGAAERRDRLFTRCRRSGAVIVDMTAETALPIVMTPGADRGTVRADRRDVRGVGDRRDRASDAHRSRHGIHAMTEAVIEAIDVVKFLGSGAGSGPGAQGRELVAHRRAN